MESITPMKTNLSEDMQSRNIEKHPTLLMQDEEFFKKLILATQKDFLSKGISLKEQSIEKDYHVYNLIKTVAQSEKDNVANMAIFKGGTSLSKVWKLIERFSEDIDFCIDPSVHSSNRQYKESKLLVFDAVNEVYPEKNNQRPTMSRGFNINTEHPYPKAFPANNSTIKDNLVLEVTSFNFNRKLEFSKEYVTPYIGDYLCSINRNDLVEKFNLQPVQIGVLLPQYTLCDKLLRINKEANSINSVDNIGEKIRDIYDIYCMLNNEKIKEFFYSDDFAKLFDAAKQDERVSKGKELKPFSQTALFTNPTEVLSLQEKNYENIFHLFFTRPPLLSQIADTFTENFKRFQQLDG